ncbi:DUF397 domain-containing protein [Actinorhabdospora filicis]|uniref:DUF397 domain-containing protein n=1 Tax=Actinorhabdospora filicis TaxID=1785913 RepID=UPI00255747FD|nr:DUF397 domain-containing protein [Actinorhabdospora filicis]
MADFRAWRKATASTGASSNCVEVSGSLEGLVAVRDSKSRHTGHFEVSTACWRGLVADLKASRLER